MSHTPGPWKEISRTSSYIDIVGAEQPVPPAAELLDPSPDVQAFHSVCRVHNHRWGDADARLIAAAPDLLAACQRAYECCYDKNSEDGMALKAAISKATKQ